jgi:hypothetical protein
MNMPPVEIGMAISGLKAAREMLTAVVDGKNEIATMDRVLEAIRKLGDAQDNLYELREELLSKQEEVAELKQQLADRGRWEKEAARYHLVKTEGGATVWESPEPVHHHACPACFAKHSLSILQDRRTFDGSFTCPEPSCKATFLIKAPRPTTAPVRTVISTGHDPYKRRDW